MKPYADKPFTPNMRRAVLDLLDGKQPICGQPTKQRIVKFGLARWAALPLDEDESRQQILTGTRRLELTWCGERVARDAASRRRK